MHSIQTRREALGSMTELLRQYIEGKVETADFVPRFGRLFAPFDPPDSSSEGLDDAERERLDLYIELKGGWFNEDAHVVPKNPSWEYGKDTAPQAWIDTRAYRDWIRESLAAAGFSDD